ncbi:MAG: hypothetical protein CVU07_01930 [Bacteroidetes bacterium HGW-Bacteroidetes-23]|nr:MAG: hypothetical protein CVU07_01930 [Bacteroidetes bacterium HGW-Bacteroidetes-23]
MSHSQVNALQSALYLHSNDTIPLGCVGDELWPFKAVSDFFTSSGNQDSANKYIESWIEIRSAYIEKNKDSLLYFVSNASGHPPRVARDLFGWPAKESISDSKTSAGLDRTDDIKKGIYQSFKLGVEVARAFPNRVVKTAIISNLPAYRHGEEYIEPFYDVVWGFESSFTNDSEDRLSILKNDVKRPFDYIIALDHAYTRGDIL